MENIPVVIIVTPGLNRSKPIEDLLGRHTKFELIYLTATMGYDLENPSTKQIKEEQMNYGRALTQNERACAISHREARRVISTYNMGGIVLEDDARIEDVELMHTLTLNFLKSHIKRKHVLSLIAYEFGDIKKVNESKIFTIPLPSPFPLAVAYALTSQAASRLIQNSKSYVSDWPPSPCQFHFLNRGLVVHGDEASGTTIGETQNRNDNFISAVNYILEFLPPSKILVRIALLLKKKTSEKITMHLISFIQRFLR